MRQAHASGPDHQFRMVKIIFNIFFIIFGNSVMQGIAGWVLKLPP
jgi:hypothetical protein